MKRKTIQKVLASKMEEWINSIEDKEVRNLARKDTIVTGGSIASMLLNEPVKDFDIYFKTKKTCLAVADYYMSEFKKLRPEYSSARVIVGFPGGLGGLAEDLSEAELEEIEDMYDATRESDYENRVRIYIPSAGIAGQNPDEVDSDEAEAAKAVGVFDMLADEPEADEKKYRPVFLSENAITLSDKVQIVIRFHGSPEEIHGNYDFAHAMNYYEHNDKELVLKEEAMECLLNKTLIYRGSLYPICSLFRMRKFIKRGWNISAGQILKAAWQIHELDLTDRYVLTEQLTGVDAAYFSMLIDSLKDVDLSNVDAAYVCTVIDRIFGE